MEICVKLAYDFDLYSPMGAKPNFIILYWSSLYFYKG